MTKILIAYGTTEGQTARIADHLRELMRGRGLEADALNLKLSQAVSVDGYDAVVVGGSIHMGKHQEDVVEFVRKNRADLERLPSAFFSVSPGRQRRPAERRGLRRKLCTTDRLASQQGWSLQRCAAVSAIRISQALHDEEDRPRQAGHEHRHFAGLRLHRLGPGKAVRRRLPEAVC
jgi:menaquinone-dependent protoporphyrinogen IX oxidase